MNARSVIEHALRVYYVDSAEPNAIARELLAQYDAERDEEKATAPATTTTPEPAGRLAVLLDAIHTRGGEWSTAKVQALYRKSGPVAPLRAAACKDLHALHAMGHLVHHDERGRQFYTLNSSTGGA